MLPDEELVRRVSAVVPCETDEDRERLAEVLGPLTVPELAALVEALRRREAWPGAARGTADNDPPAAGQGRTGYRTRRDRGGQA